LMVRTEFQTALLGNQVYSSLTAILTLLGGAVLIVACANVAGLLTSRAPLRAREIALRLAIGAGRVRLIRQLLTESSLIAMAGGLSGLPLAYAVILVFRQVRLPAELVITPKFELDQRALLFSLAVAMGSVILFGLIPAIQTTRTNLTSAFKVSAGAETGKRRLWGRNLLVAVQVAFSLALLTVATFTSNMFRGELTHGMGFRSDHLAMLTVDPKMLRYSGADTLLFFENLAKRAAALPGAKSAALTSGMLGQNIGSASVQPEGFQFSRNQDSAILFYNRVDERYFDTFGIPILRGRGFTESDSANAQAVAVINQTFAAQYWPNQNPIGKRIRLYGTKWVEVVGVARNSHYLFIGEPPRAFFYLPYRQTAPDSMTLLVASAGDSASLLVPLRKLVSDIEPAMPMYDVMTIEEFYAAKVTGFGGVLVETVATMGLMGLALAMIGLYALMSYSVSRRTREIGIRMAVGADRARVMKMVVRQGMAPVLIGLTIGLALSAGAGKWLRAAFPLGYDIGPEIYGVMAPLLLTVALLAAFVPARRASRVDPMTALREE
jgi:predicted permease